VGSKLGKEKRERLEGQNLFCRRVMVGGKSSMRTNYLVSAFKGGKEKAGRGGGGGGGGKFREQRATLTQKGTRRGGKRKKSVAKASHRIMLTRNL